MIISFSDKISVLLSAWREAFRMQGVKGILTHLVNPVDSTRYTEFAYLFRFFRGSLKNLNILDVSSPHMLAYVLSRGNAVTKTNIDGGEGRFIQESSNLRFLCEDALNLSFPDETFDLTCCVSVVEHIYLKYDDAVREMIRVTKKGGYIYLTFPVSLRRTEEWLPYPMYPAQEKGDNGYFFQYRFGETDIENFFLTIGTAEVVSSSVYWERHRGAYDKLMAAMRVDLKSGILNLLRNAALNLYSGLFLLENRPGKFSGERGFGNISIILIKR